MSEPHKPAGAVFDAAIELPPERRAPYLLEACAGDESLRQRVEVLLRAHESAGTFMDGPAAAAGREGEVIKSEQQPGDRIGRYKLLEQIGEGGCGVVYLAEQEQPVRRRVALKVIKLGMDTKSVIARFEAERQTLALMDHPNIAKVLDAGATERGCPYFVMELVRGIKITDYCDENNLTTAARLELLIQVCRAIQHAHQKGIIHRDIKPSNILVADHDGVPVPKVIDFGIAKATSDQRLTDKTLFTAFEQFLGTPAYMSPEQARLSGLDIDTRSDIYSLGVLLYELLTARTPFEAKQLHEMGLDEIRRTIRENEPLRPSTRLQALDAAEQTTVARHRQCEPPKLLGIISGDLDWIVMKCLEKERARRYETASGLGADIQRHLSNEPVNARPPSGFYRLQKSVRRNKGAFAATGVIAAVLVIGVVVSTLEAIRARRAEREQSRLRLVAETKEKTSDQVAKFLKDMLGGVGPSRAKGRDTAMLREILDRTTERIGKDMTNEPEIEAELRTTIGDVYWQLAEYDKAEAMERSALAIRRKLYGNEHLAVADSLQNLGSVLWDRRNNQDVIEAEALQREALQIRIKLLGTNNPIIADSLTGLADVFLVSGRAAEAEPIYREALALRRRFFGDDDAWTALSVQSLADDLSAEGKLSDAESLYRQALATWRRSLGDDDPTTTASLQGLADVLRTEGKLAEAESAYREALTIRTKVLGAGHPATLGSMQNLASLLVQQGRMAEAEQLARSGLTIAENKSPDDWQTFSIEDTLGYILMQQKKYAEAEPLLLSAYGGLKQREDKIPRDNQRQVKEVIQLIVQLYRATARPDQAAEWTKKLTEFDQPAARK